MFGYNLCVMLTCVTAFVTSNFIMQPSLYPRIVGGVKIYIHEAPYHVSLQYFGIHICGGSIINRKWILTAAHCTIFKLLHGLSVRVGSAEHAKGGTVIDIEKVINHESYDYFITDYDFSLLELKWEIDLEENQQTIKLIGQDENVIDGNICTVIGWGNTKNVNESTDWLRSTNVPIVNHELCTQYYPGCITERMICAGYELGQQDACQGDSGGPLVCNNILVGVVSWGSGCGEPAHPGVYSKIASVRHWVEKTISN